MRMPRPLIYLWVLPTTAIGLPLTLAALLTGGKARILDGVLEVHGGVARIYLRRVVGVFLTGGASAMTVGHIVIALDAKTLAATRSHERIHVRQCERWGPFFIPAYFAASVFQWMRGRRAYLDNPFERQAYDSE